MNMAVFGAEQIQEDKFTSGFFDKYLLAVNMGAIFAKGTFFSLETSDPYSVPYIYGMSTLFVAMVLFFIGYRYYIHVKSGETILTKCFPVLFNAFQTWRLFYRNKPRVTKKARTSPVSNTAYNPDVIVEDDDSMNMILQISTYLDYAKATNGGRYLDRIVDDVKSLRNAVVVFALLIPYWLVYDQVRSH